MLIENRYKHALFVTSTIGLTLGVIQFLSISLFLISLGHHFDYEKSSMFLFSLLFLGGIWLIILSSFMLFSNKNEKLISNIKLNIFLIIFSLIFAWFDLILLIVVIPLFLFTIDKIKNNKIQLENAKQ